jgi:hypothetical protein
MSADDNIERDQVTGEITGTDIWTRLLLTVFQTIAFMHCRNIVVEEVTPPAKLSKKHQKKHGGGPLLKYKRVLIEPMREHKVKRARGTGHGDGSKPRLHIVPGHFAHYGDCCPTQHEPKGLLFGKYQGMVWIEMHARGDRGEGVLVHDYDIRV